MPRRIGRDIVVHVPERKLVGRGGARVQGELLVLLPEQLADVVFTHCGVDIGKLVINACNKLAQRVVDAAGNLFCRRLRPVAIYINRGLPHCLCKKKPRGSASLAHFHFFRLFDLLKFRYGIGGVKTDELLDFERGAYLVQKCPVIRQNDKNAAALPGKHAHCGFVRRFIAVRRQNVQCNIIALVCLIGTVVHDLVKAELITPVERGIAVFLFIVNAVENQLGNLRVDFRRVNVLPLDRAVYLLFFIGQEHINFTVLLNKRLAHQPLQRFLHALRQFHAVFIDAGDHQAGNVVYVGGDLLDILDHEQGLEDIDVKTLGVMLRVQIFVVQRARDHALMRMVKKLLKGVVEHIKGHQRTRGLLHDSDGGFLEHCQHGAFALGKVLAGGAVRADGGKDAAQQVELVRNERIDRGEILPVGIELLLDAVVENDQIFDDGRLVIVEKRERFFAGRVLLQNTLPDDFVHVGGGQREAGIKTALNLRKVVALCFRNGVNVLLAGDDDPRFAAAGSAKVFRHRLQVEHQPGIFADILANLVYKEHDVMIAAFFIDVFFYKIGETLNADGIWLGCFFAPVARRLLTHEAHCGQNFHYIVLDEIKVVARLLPGRTERILEPAFELAVFAVVGKLAFQVCKERDGTAEALHFVENL